MEILTGVAIIAALISAGAAAFNIYFTITRSRPSIHVDFQPPPPIQFKENFNDTGYVKASLLNDGSEAFSILKGEYRLEASTKDSPYLASGWNSIGGLPKRLESGDTHEVEFRIPVMWKVASNRKYPYTEPKPPLEISCYVTLELRIGRSIRKFRSREFHFKVFECKEHFSDQSTREEKLGLMGLPPDIMKEIIE